MILIQLTRCRFPLTESNNDSTLSLTQKERFEILTILKSSLLPIAVKYLIYTVATTGVKQMLKRWFLSTLLFLISLLFASNINASELRGRLTGLPGASVDVSCNGYDDSLPLSNNGTYSIMGLPSGKNCSFTVSTEDAKSVKIPFSTSRSVTIYNGQVKKFGGRIVVIRE